jgi:hypothetical protein
MGNYRWICLALAGFCLAACSCPSPSTTPVKSWSIPEQIQIAKERNLIADSEGDKPLFDASGNRIHFPMTAAVFQEWETLRREAR